MRQKFEPGRGTLNRHLGENIKQSFPKEGHLKIVIFFFIMMQHLISSCVL